MLHLLTEIDKIDKGTASIIALLLLNNKSFVDITIGEDIKNRFYTNLWNPEIFFSETGTLTNCCLKSVKSNLQVIVMKVCYEQLHVGYTINSD